MAANQLRAPSLIMGWPSWLIANSATLTLSGSGIWLAFSFVLDQTKTLNKVKLYMVTKTGTPGTTDLTCDLYSNSTSNIPNASIDGPMSADAVGASGTWVQWSGFTTSCTAGTQYWLVFKNANGTPASNNPTYQWTGSPSTLGPIAIQGTVSPSAGSYGWNKLQTANSGSSWTTPNPGAGGPRLEFSDSTYDGMPFQSIVRPASGTTANRAFGTQEVGVRFNIPSGVTYNVKGVGMFLNKTSTPGDLRFRLYQGTTLLGTTNPIAAADVSSTLVGDWFTAYFSSPISIISTNNPFRVVMGDATAGDGNTVGYNPALYTLENDAGSLGLKPMNGTLQKTITADNTASPVVFSDTATDIIPFALLMDTAGELTASGGGLIVNPGVGGRLI